MPALPPITAAPVSRRRVRFGPLVDRARHFASGHVWTAVGLQGAGVTVRLAGAIEQRRIVIRDMARVIAKQKQTHALQQF